MFAFSKYDSIQKLKLCIYFAWIKLFQANLELWLMWLQKYSDILRFVGCLEL